MGFSTNPKTVMISKQVESVEFGFYTDQLVLERSVAEITLPACFDATGTPLPGGLYDPRLGSVSNSKMTPYCPTCCLNVVDCPGHFGHIALSVPVYHPLLFGEIVHLLKLKCFACHRFAMTQHQLAVWTVKFQLLCQQRITEYFALDKELARSGASAREALRQLTTTTTLSTPSTSSTVTPSTLARASHSGMQSILNQYNLNEIEDVGHNSNLRKNSGSQSQSQSHVFPPWTSYVRQLRKELVQEFIQARVRTCHHCGATCPVVRGDQHNKVFVKFPQKKKKKMINSNQAAKSRRKSDSVHDRDNRNDDDDEDEAAFPDRADNNAQIESALPLHQSNHAAASNITGDSSDIDGTENDSDVDDGESTNGNNEENDNVNSDELTVLETPDHSLSNHQQLHYNHERYMHPGEVQAQLTRTWECHAFLCNAVFGSLSDIQQWKTNPLSGLEKFFLKRIAVTPSRFRPPMTLGGMTVEHAQTQYFAQIMQHNEGIQQFLTSQESGKAYSAWMSLQSAVNEVMDSTKGLQSSGGSSSNAAPGIRQIIEAKEGLFRRNMMGKRVDFCCRSVISPDPYIGANEIGLPQHFAKVLTYPNPVTHWNAAKMRALVERGITSYPGARWVEMHGKRTDLTKMNHLRRQAVAANLLSCLKTGIPAVVGRQLVNGDYVLMNRQPTLHKPGAMAHLVRILHNPMQKTIRMHYANCNTYNADYDGDEMNCHFPQNELARSEAKHIAGTDNQYIVPTDGTPLRGLIQDHIVGGVKLTQRDTFLEKWEYQQLTFAALTSLSGLDVVPPEVIIDMLPPAILKPRLLWTGKQVISTLLLHLRKGNKVTTSDLPGLSLARKAKTPDVAFGPEQEEHLVLIRDGELLRGVLDKAAFGATAFSLAHGVYEAYGPEKAGMLLNALGRLFTAYIQYFAGHSCRMEDLVLTKLADQERRILVQRSCHKGARAAKAWADADGGKISIPAMSNQPNTAAPLTHAEIASTTSKIAQLLTGIEGANNRAALDSYMQSQLNPMASEIVKSCLPNGLAVRFPFNSFSIMTVTGAKGSIVNQSQISCVLGQQALEGRRVPRMSSGKTLPSFLPFDPNPRADGFVLDRFLSGVRPQEYYFHCMAGREGLVDTAVKTSRSGYLQRCLVKHLEDLKVCYDYTVRNAERGIVQFLYGEDGLDPTKAAYLDCTDKSFDFMAMNHCALRCRNSALPDSSIVEAGSVARSVYDMERGRYEFPKEGDYVLARRVKLGSTWERGLLCKGWYKAFVMNVSRHGTHVDIKYVSDGKAVKNVPILFDLGDSATVRTLTTEAVLVKPLIEDPLLCSSNSMGLGVGVNGTCVSEKVALSALKALSNKNMKMFLAKSSATRDAMSKLIAAKYSAALVSPGEAVGCIAAQSVGEPSTQMTLNTFHLAGSGANVTLGIPRLREIIMTASRVPKTPTMSVPLHDCVTDEDALRMTNRLTKINLLELIASVNGVRVVQAIENTGMDEWMRTYRITLKFHPAERIYEAFELTLHDVAKVVSKSFIPRLSAMMVNELRRAGAATDVTGGDSSDYVADRNKSDAHDDEKDDLHVVSEEEGEDDDEDGDIATEEDGVDAVKYRQRSDSASYESDDDSDIENASTGKTPLNHDSAIESSPEYPRTTRKSPSNSFVSPKVNPRSNSITLQPLSVDPGSPPLLMADLVEKAASLTLIRSIKGLDHAFVNDEEGRGQCLQTLGVNFEEMWRLPNVDHNRLTSNHIWAMLTAYGVEAARSSIVEQIKSVFGAYGITVDARHLSLIADYMTFEGGYKPMNRSGMEWSSSPFVQMSFETSVNFLKQAAMLGNTETMLSPSSNIVLGRPVQHGTGSFELLARPSNE